MGISVAAMPPKTTPAAPKSKANVKSMDRSRLDVCTEIIVGLFPDFAEDTAFCSHLAITVIEYLASATGPDAFDDALGDALLGVPEPGVILGELYAMLIDAQLLEANGMVQ